MPSSSSRASTPSSSGASDRSGSPIHDERKPIDRNLPRLVVVTLARWLEIWYRMDQAGDTRGRDLFALTGHYTDPDSGKRRRAKIDLESCRPQPAHTVHQISDIDSVVAKMTGRIPIAPGAVLKYHMILNPSYTLHKDIGIPGVKVVRGGREEEIPLHKMPNTRILELEPQGLIRIHWPYLELPNGGVCPDQEHMNQWYDLVWRPAAADVLPEELVREWPATMDDEKFRAATQKNKAKHKEKVQEDHEREMEQGQQQKAGEKRGSHLSDCARDIHPEYLNQLLDRCREIITVTPEVSWARNFVLGYEMKGLKNRVDSVHPPPDSYLTDEHGNLDDENPHLRTIQINALLRNFDTDEFEENSWFLDLATRVVVSDDLDSPSACTFASTNRHARLLSHFTGLSYDRCLELSRGSNFRVDEVAHLNNVSGGKLTLSRADFLATGIVFVQIYTSDKSVTYNLSLPNGAQRITAPEMLKSYDHQRRAHITPLIRAFGNSAITHGVALRIETRVEFGSYPISQLRIPDDVVKPCLYRLEREDFWGWKVARSISLDSVASQWMLARRTFLLPALPVAGTLLLLLQYMMNALVNRPDSGGNWDMVRDTGCVHIMQRGQLVPHRPLGAYFLGVLHLEQGKQPRVSIQRTLPPDRICYLLGTQAEQVNEMAVYHMITGVGQKRPREPDATAIGPPRVGNKQRRVKIMSKEATEDRFAGLVPGFEVEHYPSEEEDSEERQPVAHPTQILTELVNSFPIQIMAKAPNKAGGGSWCRLTPKKRSEIKFDFFSSMNTLPEAFEVYTQLPVSAETWDKMVEALFPLVGENGDPYENSQGFKTLGVRIDFIKLQLTLPPNQREMVVKDVRQRVTDSWAWLPCGLGKGHLWGSGHNPGRVTFIGPGRGGPWMALNPRFADE
ncbi:hypothetical protein RSOLAG22IIIB_10079 [Rhizoctonia solani]|uniref:Uncharacterized protein n=1 Tax=Rhizoctonia solani TaxID=456999 RepID=A0A0K6G162_9AGAM|nr:hypothetical protein RSOLAG22IIIB_10079 [Rhizoctonia solani]